MRLLLDYKLTGEASSFLLSIAFFTASLKNSVESAGKMENLYRFKSGRKNGKKTKHINESTIKLRKLKAK